jgi:hypothetical protein
LAKSKADQLEELLSKLKSSAQEHAYQLSKLSREREWFARATKATGTDEFGRHLFDPPTVDELADVAFWLEDLASDISADLEDAINELNRLKVVRPRLKDRDTEIVRLRDKEKLTFGQIKREIRRKQEWAVMQNGKPITVAAIKAAYLRACRMN